MGIEDKMGRETHCAPVLEIAKKRDRQFGEVCHASVGVLIGAGGGDREEIEERLRRVLTRAVTSVDQRLGGGGGGGGGGSLERVP